MFTSSTCIYFLSKLQCSKEWVQPAPIFRLMQKCGSDWSTYQKASNSKQNKEKEGRVSEMKRLLSVVLGTVLLLLCLSSCTKGQTIVGQWQDDSGYHLQFYEDGTFKEDVYGIPLNYTYDGSKITYSWADGYMRYTDISSDNGKLSFRINGKDRVFSPSKSSPAGEMWSPEEIDSSISMAGKFMLLSNAGVNSELRLFAGNLFSLSWSAEGSQNESWKTPSDTCVLGKYADRGAGESLVLFTADDMGSVQYEQLTESANGNYVAAMPLSGTITAVDEDWSSPVHWRGYTIDGIIGDHSSMLNYHFSRDNTVVKELSDGVTLNYAYFIDKDGLVTLSCLDGFLETDTMWFDVTTRTMYRMVYERDSWVDYMYAIALADKMTTIEGDGSTVDSSHILDEDLLMPNMTDSYDLPGSRGSVLDSFYILLSETDESKSMADYNYIQDSQTTLANELLTKEEQEAQRQKDKEEFLAEMGVLAEQKRIADAETERLFKEQMMAEGYVYDSETDTWYIPGSSSSGEFGEYNPWENPDSSVSLPSGGSSIQPGAQLPDGTVIGSSTSFGGGGSSSQPPEEDPDEEPVEKPADATVATVKFICNCNTCHTDDYPVLRGASNMALIDPLEWTPGWVVMLGDKRNSPQVTLVDSKGSVIGNVIEAYFADHNWVEAQSDGTYTVLRVVG